MPRVMTVFGFILLLATMVQAAELVNVDKAHLALQGFDPVAFFTEGKAVPGSDGITATYQGAVYRFASDEHRSMFQKDPGHFAPAFGGFCAYGVSKSQKAPVEIDTWQIFQNRLLLNYDQKVKALFDADREGNLKKADSNWPALVEKSGK